MFVDPTVVVPFDQDIDEIAGADPPPVVPPDTLIVYSSYSPQVTACVGLVISPSLTSTLILVSPLNAPAGTVKLPVSVCVPGVVAVAT